MAKAQNFETYLLETGQEILKYLIKIGASKEDAEDIIQNTFYKILQLTETVRPSQVRSWMYRVAINNYFDLKRREKVQKEKLTEIKYVETLETVETFQDERVLEVIQQLKPEYREILLLKYYFECSAKEIADILLIKENSVKTKLYRAREAAKTIVRKEET